MQEIPKVFSKRKLNEDDIIEVLLAVSQKKSDGLILVIDEMGKFLEHSTQSQGHGDIYFLQKLAEAACRSNGRLILIGLLHQSFQMYSNQLEQRIQKEWAKVQGRYADIPIIIPQEEQAKIVSCAINSNPPKIPKSFQASAKIIQKHFGNDLEFQKHLEGCWPLHPATVCLLSQFARSEYAQNQRSIFTFLNSREPCGFQEFLSVNKTGEAFYTPDIFWDYLKANLESSIVLSRDGHKWALVEDCIARARLIEADGPIEKIIKIVGVSYLLGNLKTNKETLQCCLGREAKVESLLKALEKKSILVHRKHLDKYAPFEGTDFDIEIEKKKEIQKDLVLDGKRIAEISGLRPILARRHGIETGTSRYMEMSVIPPDQNLDSIKNTISEIEKRKGYETSLCGLFLIDLRDHQRRKEQKIPSELTSGAPIIVETPKVAPAIRNLVIEIAALESVKKRPELQGDRIARVEVENRIIFASEKLRNFIDDIFEGYRWLHEGKTKRATDLIDMSNFASDKADIIFDKSPLIRNEILNRNKVSGSGNGALKKLMIAMLSNIDKEDLGMTGYPAEKGLYLSVLKYSKLHRNSGGQWNIHEPSSDPLRIVDCWQAAVNFLKTQDERVSIHDLYQVWKNPPYGINQGLMQLLAWSLILAYKSNISVYVSKVYRPNLGEEDVESMLLGNTDIELMWVTLDKKTESFLSDISESIKWRDSKPSTISPLAISRALVSQVISLPAWVRRTNTLSPSARRFRNLLQRANDPNKVIFEDLMGSNGKTHLRNKKQLVESVKSAITELDGAYDKMLLKFEDRMLEALEATSAPESICERAGGLSAKTGNFRLDAFIQRLIEYRPKDAKSIENILGLVANKPPEHWTDRDLDSAYIELGELSVNFLKAEIYVRVDGQKSSNLAIAWITTGNSKTSTKFEEFSIQKGKLPSVQKIAETLVEKLNEEFSSREECLATIAEMGKKFSVSKRNE